MFNKKALMTPFFAGMQLNEGESLLTVGYGSVVGDPCYGYKEGSFGSLKPSATVPYYYAGVEEGVAELISLYSSAYNNGKEQSHTVIALMPSRLDPSNGGSITVTFKNLYSEPYIWGELAVNGTSAIGADRLYVSFFGASDVGKKYIISVTGYAMNYGGPS